MQRKLLLSVISALFVTACATAPDLGKLLPEADTSAEVGDVCAILAELKWEASDADSASDTLAMSLDRVIELEEEHGCK